MRYSNTIGSKNKTNHFSGLNETRKTEEYPRPVYILHRLIYGSEDTRISSYSSGAAVTDLEHVTYISLDTYRSLGQNEIKTKLDAWLTFFSYEDPEHVISLVNKYPEFLPLYRNIAEFRHKPEEVIGMFSEALKIMDRNTTKYMIDELKQTITDQNQTIADYSNKITTLEAENIALKAQLAAK